MRLPAATVPERRTRPHSGSVGLTKMMYAITRKVVSPARISVPTEVPARESLKKESKPEPPELDCS